MCLGLDLVCHVMCYCSLFVPFITFSCVLAYWFRPDLNPMVFVIIHTPGPTSKGLDHSIFHVHACLLLYFMLVIASLVLGLATLDALSGFVVVWLHLTTIKSCLDVTIWDASPWCRLLRAYLFPFPFRAMTCLPCLFMKPIGFLCILTRLFTCPCISLAY